MVLVFSGVLAGVVGPSAAQVYVKPPRAGEVEEYPFTLQVSGEEPVTSVTRLTGLAYKGGVTTHQETLDENGRPLKFYWDWGGKRVWVRASDASRAGVDWKAYGRTDKDERVGLGVSTHCVFICPFTAVWTHDLRLTDPTSQEVTVLTEFHEPYHRSQPPSYDWHEFSVSRPGQTWSAKSTDGRFVSRWRCWRLPGGRAVEHGSHRSAAGGKAWRLFDCADEAVWIEAGSGKSAPVTYDCLARADDKWVGATAKASVTPKGELSLAVTWRDKEAAYTGLLVPGAGWVLVRAGGSRVIPCQVSTPNGKVIEFTATVSRGVGATAMPKLDLRTTAGQQIEVRRDLFGWYHVYPRAASGKVAGEYWDWAVDGDEDVPARMKAYWQDGKLLTKVVERLAIPR